MDGPADTSLDQQNVTAHEPTVALITPNSASANGNQTPGQRAREAPSVPRVDTEGQRLVLDENRLSQEADNEFAVTEKPATKGNAARASVCKGNAAESSHSRMVVYRSTKLNSAQNSKYGLSNGIVISLWTSHLANPPANLPAANPAGGQVSDKLIRMEFSRWL